MLVLDLMGTGFISGLPNLPILTIFDSGTSWMQHYRRDFLAGSERGTFILSDWLQFC
jgi:hypothetical protein